jgi:hypothetical protein
MVSLLEYAQPVFNQIARNAAKVTQRAISAASSFDTRLAARRTALYKNLSDFETGSSIAVDFPLIHEFELPSNKKKTIATSEPIEFSDDTSMDDSRAKKIKKGSTTAPKKPRVTKAKTSVPSRDETLPPAVIPPVTVTTTPAPILTPVATSQQSYLSHSHEDDDAGSDDNLSDSESVTMTGRKRAVLSTVDHSERPSRKRARSPEPAPYQLPFLRIPGPSTYEYAGRAEGERKGEAWFAWRRQFATPEQLAQRALERITADPTLSTDLPRQLAVNEAGEKRAQLDAQEAEWFNEQRWRHVDLANRKPGDALLAETIRRNMVREEHARQLREQEATFNREHAAQAKRDAAREAAFPNYVWAPPPVWRTVDR